MSRKKNFKVPTPCLDITWNISNDPNKPDFANYAYVGSCYCKKCVFNKRTNDIKKFVLCSF